jgi:hypothetical protein
MPPRRPRAPRGAIRIPIAPSASVLAGQALLRAADLERVLDPKTLELVEAHLAPLLPGTVLQPGVVAPPRALAPDALQLLVRAAAVTAAGLDPARTPSPAPPVLWELGGNQLLVDIANVRAQPGDGLIDVVVPVQCDQTGAVEITATFVTGSADRPAGGIAVTESRPRGPAAVVDAWAEPLIAFAWHALVSALAALSSTGATDPAGQPLVTVEIVASPNGVLLSPMARHQFDRFGQLE